MKAKLIRDMRRVVSKTVGTTTKKVFESVPKGTVLDHAEAFHLVKMGVAHPADDECAFAAGMTPEQMKAAAARYEEIAAGIHPEDLALFRAGKITGYRGEYDPATELPSMQYARGPNWTDADAEAIDGEVDDEHDAEEPATHAQAAV